MSLIKPFRALRPRSDLAKQVSSVPYDVCSRRELAALVRDNPHSFLRVTRAEAEVADGVDSESREVFDLAKQNLQKLIDEKILIAESEASLYVYRLESGENAQTGVVACCSLDEYENDLIKKHEKTRPDKVADRARHMLTVKAQTGLIFLAFRGTPEIDELIARAVADAPLYDFVCVLNVRHTIWRVGANEELIRAFARVPALYVADGHHRLEAAARARHALREKNQSHDDGGEDYNFVVAGIFPENELRILPYNRVVKDLNGLSADEFLHRLGADFTVAQSDDSTPRKPGEICLYLGAAWYQLNLKEEAHGELIERLDVSVLQNRILAPILKIEDAQTDNRIEFVGGARGSRELEKIVDSGRMAAAFAMFPTAIEDLLQVSDVGGVMPPKSTWFEPKLRDGLLVHLI